MSLTSVVDVKSKIEKKENSLLINIELALDLAIYRSQKNSFHDGHNITLSVWYHEQFSNDLMLAKLSMNSAEYDLINASKNSL